MTFYSKLLLKYPLRTQIATTSILMATGDMISQTLVEGRKSFSEISLKRVATFAVFGMGIAGPAMVNW